MFYLLLFNKPITKINLINDDKNINSYKLTTNKQIKPITYQRFQNSLLLLYYYLKKNRPICR